MFNYRSTIWRSVDDIAFFFSTKGVPTLTTHRVFPLVVKFPNLHTPHKHTILQ